MAAAVDQWVGVDEVPAVGHIVPTSVQAVTPSDTVDLTNVSRGIYVGVAGNVAVILGDFATTITFTGVPAGTIIPVRASRVKATGTTATSMVALS